MFTEIGGKGKYLAYPFEEKIQTDSNISTGYWM